MQKDKFAFHLISDYNTPTYYDLIHFPMNYAILKTIIDSTIQNYNQNNPTQTVNEQHVSLINMTQHGLDLLIRCPHTQKEIRIHAEVNFMNGANNIITNNGITTTTQHINDDDVTAIHKALQKNTSISDLFWE